MTDSRRRLTASQVHDVVFSAPPIGKQGYNAAEVDTFLGLIEQRIEARNQLSAHDVRNVGFNKPPLFRRGYDEDEVDTFLDLATDTIAALEERQR